MSSPTVDEHFLNSLLAGFLISSLPVKEQLIPRQWLRKLHPVNGQCNKEKGSSECDEKRKRENLLKNLLIGLLKSELPDIFREPSPSRCLPESPEAVFSIDAAPGTKWASDLEATAFPDDVVQPSSWKFSTPTEFFSKQPTPRNGAVCYGGVFSQPPTFKF